VDSFDEVEHTVFNNDIEILHCRERWALSDHRI